MADARLRGVGEGRRRPFTAPPLPALVGGDSGVHELPTPQPRQLLRTNGNVRRQYEVPCLVGALLFSGQLRDVHLLRRASQDSFCLVFGQKADEYWAARVNGVVKFPNSACLYRHRVRFDAA